MNPNPCSETSSVLAVTEKMMSAGTKPARGGAGSLAFGQPTPMLWRPLHLPKTWKKRIIEALLRYGENTQRRCGAAAEEISIGGP